MNIIKVFRFKDKNVCGVMIKKNSLIISDIDLIIFQSFYPLIILNYISMNTNKCKRMKGRGSSSIE